MCNDFGRDIPYDVIREAFSEIRIPVRFPDAAPNLEAKEDLWPTEIAPLIRQVDGGAEFAALRWGFPPPRPRAGPVINLRSEGRRFPARRCLVPVSHFFEFTGSRSPKSKWRFTRTGQEWFCLAALSRPADGDAADAFALFTTSPGPDVAPIHDRQVAVIDRDDWAAWLSGDANEAALLRPLPAGALTVVRVR